MWIMFFFGIGLGMLAPFISRWLMPRPRLNPEHPVQQPRRVSLGSLLWLLLTGSLLPPAAPARGEGAG